MIMNTRCEEEVHGEIVGPYLRTGTVRYEGRQQGKPIYGESEAELVQAANDYVKHQRTELGALFETIYPKDAWELRIHLD